jgi:hypothetical protein
LTSVINHPYNANYERPEYRANYDPDRTAGYCVALIAHFASRPSFVRFEAKPLPNPYACRPLKGTCSLNANSKRPAFDQIVQVPLAQASFVGKAYKCASRAGVDVFA